MRGTAGPPGVLLHLLEAKLRPPNINGSIVGIRSHAGPVSVEARDPLLPKIRIVWLAEQRPSMLLQKADGGIALRLIPIFGGSGRTSFWWVSAVTSFQYVSSQPV